MGYVPYGEQVLLGVDICDPTGLAALNHTDKSGWKRVGAELADCVGVTLFYGLAVSVTAGPVTVGVNLGSVEVTKDKKGTTASDTVGFEASIDTFGYGSVGLSIEKTTDPVMDKDSTFADSIVNVWTSDSKVNVDLMSAVKNIDISQETAGEDIIASVGAKCGVGIEGHLNITEVANFVRYVRDEIKSFIKKRKEEEWAKSTNTDKEKSNNQEEKK